MKSMRYWTIGTFLAGTVVIVGPGISAHATLLLFSNQQLAQTTTFNIGVDVDNLAGSPSISQSGGSIDEDGAAGTAFTDADLTNHSAGSAMGFDSGSNDAPTNQWTLGFNSTGFENMTFRFDYRSTATGSPSIALDYQVGGGGFIVTVHGPGTGSFSRRIQERCLVLLGGCPTWFPGKCACPPLVARERLRIHQY